MEQDSLKRRISAVEKRLEALAEQQDDPAGLRDELSAILVEIREASEAVHLQREEREEQEKAQLANCLLRSLLDVIPAGVIVSDGTGTVLMNNPVAESILDGGLAGVLQHPQRAHTTHRPDGGPFPVEEMPLVQTLKTGQVVRNVEILVRRSDGRERVILASAAPVTDEAEQVVSGVAVFQDITERKRTEEMLQRERTIFHVIMESTRAHLAYLDTEFNFVEVNSTYARACGHSREELVGQNHFDLFPHEENQAIFERVRDTGEPVEFHADPFEFPDRPELGTTYWDWTLTPVKDEIGEIEGLVLSLLDVTEQIRAQIEIENLSLFPGQNPNPVLRMAKDGTILYANASSAPLLSWCDAQVGKEGPTEWQRRVAVALDTGEVQRFEVICDDLTYLLAIAPVPEEGYANLYGMDITERVRSEQALRESEQKLRALFEILPVGVSVLDEARNIQLVNPALAHILDLSLDQLVSGEYGDRTYLRVDGSEMTPDEFPSNRAFREQRSVHNVEIGIVTSDGERIWTNVSAVPLPFSDWRVILTTTDMTSQRQAEAALRQTRDELELRVQERTAELAGINELLRAEIAERQRVEANLRVSEQRFRQVAENIDQVLWLAEPESGQLLYINPAYEEIWGRPVEDWPHDLQEFMDDVHPDDRDRLSLIPEEQTVEFRIIRSDDKVRWIRARVFPIHGRSGQLYRLAGVAEDVSKQKQTMNALLYAEQLAVAGKMAASLAHEINNPLQAAIGCLGLAQQQLEMGGDAHDYLGVTVEALQRTSRIVEQLRALHQRTELEDKEPADVNALLEKVLILTRKKCGDSNVEVVWTAAPDLPALELMSDAMHQVFLNLVLNAVEAMPTGGRLLVQTSRTQQPPGIEIEFADEGVGIPPDELDHLFDPFYTTKTNSLGLGLFVSQSIVQQHGGHIEVDSRPDEGTSFAVWLPL
jgi:PAS domain S-box-containing protein